MATTIVMPQMGYDMKEGTVVRWHKKENEAVSRGEVIAEIETDKAVVEMEAYKTGVLRKIVVEEGKTVPVGQLIAVITDPDEALPSVEELAGQVEQPSDVISSAPEASPSPRKKETPQTSASTAVKASPLARRLAREKGFDLSAITGTGPGGRITEGDVTSYEEGAPAPAVEGVQGERVELTRMRQAIARVTSQSKREIPHFYVSAEIDMTSALAVRRDLNVALNDQVRISVNDFIIKTVTKVLERYPNFNASFQEDHLQLNASVHMGIAVALEQGLIVPTINNCQDKSLVEIAKASHALVERTQKGTLRAEDYTGSTFSISNLGMFEVENFVAIILPPHAAVLAVGKVMERPVVREGQIRIAQMMKATLSVDHRVADGAEAARFIGEVKRLLENPATLLL